MTESLRIDKWLFFARFFKSRGLAADAVESGRIHLNGRVVGKIAQPVKVGDELVFPTGARWWRVRVATLGQSRRPAPEARLLYEIIE